MNTSKNCIIDCRVSDKQQLEGGSLEDQEKICRMYAERNGWEVLKVFRKSHSATTTVRDDISDIKDWVRSSKKPVDFYIVKSLDRLTRAGYVEQTRLKNELAALGVSVVDTVGTVQEEQNTLAHLNMRYKWSMFSNGEIGEMIGAYQAQTGSKRHTYTFSGSRNTTQARRLRHASRTRRHEERTAIYRRQKTVCTRSQ